MSVVLFVPVFQKPHVRGLKTIRVEGYLGRVQAVCSCGWEGPVREGAIPPLVHRSIVDWNRHDPRH